MEINSISFLAFFIVVFLIYYFPLKEKTRTQNAFLLLASYFFYGMADWRMLSIIIIATTVFYFVGIRIERLEKNTARLFTQGGVTLGVGLLLYFKYLNFFIGSFINLFNAMGFHCNTSTFNIILPLGISFFTLKLIAYVLEVYWNRMPACRSFIDFATYVAFFPTITMGPIDRPNEFVAQLQTKRTFDYTLAVDGTKQILWGIFKKMVVADNIATIVDNVWADIPGTSSLVLVITACLYSIQIYADFSGYSDVAIGVGKILGFRVMQNFSYPYFARNMQEFWRKWHISLTSWLTDYIYKPLGGSRCNRARQLTNIMIVFLVSGLWHGANWTFVFWGAYHGLLLTILTIVGGKKYKNTVAENKFLPSFKELCLIIGTFGLTTVGWVIFRAPDMASLTQYLIGIFCNGGWAIPHGQGLTKALFFSGAIVFLEWLHRTKEHGFDWSTTGWFHYKAVRIVVYYIAVLLILFYSGRDTQFIYAQF